LAVDCNGVGRYFQMAPTASLIWDRIIILEGGVTPQSADVGEWVTVWFKAVYEYDNKNFYGTLLVNDSETQYSSANERWELSYKATTPGTFTFEVTSIQDETFPVVNRERNIDIRIIVGDSWLLPKEKA